MLLEAKKQIAESGPSNPIPLYPPLDTYLMPEGVVPA
jgi:hypothetical protein